MLNPEERKTFARGERFKIHAKFNRFMLDMKE